METSLLWPRRFRRRAAHVRTLTSTSYLDPRIFSLVAEHSQLMSPRSVRLENLLGVKMDLGASARAQVYPPASNSLAFLPEHRRSDDIFAEMGRLIQQLKDESRTSAERLFALLH